MSNSVSHGHFSSCHPGIDPATFVTRLRCMTSARALKPQSMPIIIDLCDSDDDIKPPSAAKCTPSKALPPPPVTPPHKSDLKRGRDADVSPSASQMHRTPKKQKAAVEAGWGAAEEVKASASASRGSGSRKVSGGESGRHRLKVKLDMEEAQLGVEEAGLGMEAAELQAFAAMGPVIVPPTGIPVMRVIWDPYVKVSHVLCFILACKLLKPSI